MSAMQNQETSKVNIVLHSRLWNFIKIKQFPLAKTSMSRQFHTNWASYLGLCQSTVRRYRRQTSSVITVNDLISAQGAK